MPTKATLEDVHKDLDDIWIQKDFDDENPQLSACDVFNKFMERVEEMYEKYGWEVPEIGDEMRESLNPFKKEVDELNETKNR